MVQAPPAPPFRPHSELDPLVLPRLGAQALEGDGQLRDEGTEQHGTFRGSLPAPLPPLQALFTAVNSGKTTALTELASAFVTVPASGFSSVK